MTNDIDFTEIRNDYHAGWVCWVAMGYLDTATCMENTDAGDVRRSFEFRDGYEAAERANALGDSRPTRADADAAADAYVDEIKADAVSTHRAQY